MWLWICEQKWYNDDFTLVEEMDVFMAGQISFLAVMVINFAQWSYHRSIYASCRESDKDFQEVPTRTHSPSRASPATDPLLARRRGV